MTSRTLQEWAPHFLVLTSVVQYFASYILRSEIWLDKIYVIQIYMLVLLSKIYY